MVISCSLSKDQVEKVARGVRGKVRGNGEIARGVHLHRDVLGRDVEGRVRAGPRQTSSLLAKSNSCIHVKRANVPKQF